MQSGRKETTLARGFSFVLRHLPITSLPPARSSALTTDGRHISTFAAVKLAADTSIALSLATLEQVTGDRSGTNANCHLPWKPAGRGG
jgi:hypothetical protein